MKDSSFCPPGCFKCPTKVLLLSYVANVHLIACIVYLILTLNMDTPFKDSLTEEQKNIKNESSEKRRRVYTTGLLIGICTVYMWNKHSLF